MLALARKDRRRRSGLEDVFAQAQRVAAGAEALLVDEEWRVPEPEPVEIGVGVGVVSEAVADAAAREPQRTLFLWAEFMAEEPAESKR